ncbi:unnamed protein product [Sphagnum jensenii]
MYVAASAISKDFSRRLGSGQLTISANERRSAAAGVLSSAVGRQRTIDFKWLCPEPATSLPSYSAASYAVRILVSLVL